MEPSAIICYIMVLSLYLLSGVSQKHCGFYLSLLQTQLNDFTRPSAVSYPRTLPLTIDTVVERAQITPKSKSYICCPKCFALYDPDSKNNIPQLCTFIEAPRGSECQGVLRKPGTNLPSREYIAHDFKDWLARIYSRPGAEELLDRDVFGPPASANMTDIWDGSALRNFLGPDNKIFVPPGPRDREGRLIFSLNMDSFNPFGNKQNGKHVSTGAIYMTCLNLPRDKRDKMENIFLVGIIPGPTEPSLTQINHILRPLVDVLLELWDIGLFLRRTPKYPLGRRIRAAVVPLVSDLPAAKKMAAFAGARAKNFCSHCHLTLQEIRDLNFRNWEPRTWDKHVTMAKAWKDAPTQDKREEIFNEYGLRWSELLRLPYWDPTSFVVIDSMHCFYLGLFHRHAIKIWGMDATKDDSDGIAYSLKFRDDDVRLAFAAFNTGDGAALSRLPWSTLAPLCAKLNLSCDGTKDDLLLRLEAVSMSFTQIGSTRDTVPGTSKVYLV